MTTSVNPPHWFGMPRPEGHPGPCWGARAIYRVDHVGRSLALVTIDLVYNRMQMAGGTDAERAALEAWIDTKAMPYFRARFNREAIPANDARTFVYQEGGFEAIASTKQSHGYLYLGAWALRVLTGGKGPEQDGWTCHAKPAALDGKTCGFRNANGGIRYNGLVCCASCGATKKASDDRAAKAGEPAPDAPPARDVYRVTSLASLKRIPVGTKLRLIQNGRGPCDLVRVVAKVTSVHVAFSGPDIEAQAGPGALSYLDFPRASQIRSEPDGFAIITLHGTVLARYRYED